MSAERFVKAYTVQRDYFLNEEPNFVEGERVMATRDVNFPTHPVITGECGTVGVEWVGTKFGVECNCWFVFVMTDSGHKVFSARMDELWKSIDPRWSSK